MGRLIYPPLRHQVLEGVTSSSSSDISPLLPLGSTRNSLISSISKTVSDVGAFPADRLLEAQYLQEAGIPIPTLNGDTPI